ncbi:MAG: Slp family lipoprotein [Methylococcales bacterium]
MKLYILLLFLLLLNGCMKLPPEIRNEPTAELSYSQVRNNPNSYPNTPVRWGGVIIDVENEQTYSLVQVVYYPLNYYGRPQLYKRGEGRFAVKSPEFLDPAVYDKHSEITIAGTLSGDIERMVGKKTIRIPLISSSVIHLWPDDHSYNYPGYGGFGYGYPFYGYPYFNGPYYRGGYFGPRRWQRFR